MYGEIRCCWREGVPLLVSTNHSVRKSLDCFEQPSDINLYILIEGMRCVPIRVHSDYVYLWHALEISLLNHGLKPVATNSEPRWGSSKNAK